jgi:predicted methyltransferase
MRTQSSMLLGASAALLLVLLGCTPSPPAPSGNDSPTTGDWTDASGAIAAAIADPRRLARDTARDATRNPQAILEFAGVRPGASVLDMFAGGGYYAELAAYVVGPQGRVVTYNNTPYHLVSGKERAERYAEGRLASIEHLVSENNQIELPAAAFDTCLFVLAYHDVYYLDGENGWELIDRPRMLAEMFAAIRPGGTVVVVDHVTEAGIPAEVVRTLHRIDPELIKADFLEAGFIFDGELEVLRNPDDELSVMAMMPSVRGITDRAVLRFSRP